MGAEWFTDAVAYQVNPQSYADSNDDGVGDLRGVISRLDQIASPGVEAIWFNQCFDSAFVDAGHDVSDDLRIDPRYGTKAGSSNVRRTLPMNRWQIAFARGARTGLFMTSAPAAVNTTSTETR